MNKPKQIVSLEELNQKLDIEAKRLVQAREEGVVKYVKKITVLDGDSSLIFKNEKGAIVTLKFRLNKDGNLRFAFDPRFV